ncbi:MAG: gamma carbonic anhydrase family protein [Rickettsiales bacterium]|nr:gamma carbonic anhydrase family protein [Rickettsiales bacterium]
MAQAPQILPFKGVWPTIHPSAYIAPGAVVIGDVHIGAHANIWFGCVIRGDVQSIRIGARTNVQDNTVIHVTRVTGPTHIGAEVTIGHHAVLHACTLEDSCFVGMGAVVMDDAVIARGGMLAAAALLAPRKKIAAGELWAGNPARLFRPMSEAEQAFIAISAQNYVDLAAEYAISSTNS